MSSSLFRKEAVEHQKDRLMGDVLLLQPLSFAVLTTVAFVIAALIVGLLFWGTYARKETVRGFLAPDKGIVKIYAPNVGTVTSIHVSEGSVVKAGQSLLKMSVERTMENGGDVDGLILDEIQRELVDFDSRVEGELSLKQAEMKRMQTQLDGLKKELYQMEKSLSIHGQRVEISNQRMAANKKMLDLNQVSQMGFDKLQEEHLSLLQQQQEYLRNSTAKRNNIVEIESQLISYPIQVQSKLSALEKERSDLKQRLYEIQGRSVFEVKAPISGTVDGLTINEGQWMNSQASNVLAIIPENSVMKAELYIPTRAIGFIEVGQTVRMRYDAFPHQRYGIYEGQVESVSQHILHPQELQIPLEIQEPVYRVVVVVARQSIKAYGKEMPLQAGMSLEADIIIERQSLLDWILDPLYSLKGRL